MCTVSIGRREMKTTTLFVLGLALGAAIVFGVRATSLGDKDKAETAGQPLAAGEHASREGSGTKPPSDESAHAEHAEPAGTPGTLPENEICPVMGNPVDPEVYVDYKERRIGFCCPGCDDVFLEDPETYLKKVDEELAKKRGEK